MVSMNIVSIHILWESHFQNFGTAHIIYDYFCVKFANVFAYSASKLLMMAFPQQFRFWVA